jgi:hypothetical protein
MQFLVATTLVGLDWIVPKLTHVFVCVVFI